MFGTSFSSAYLSIYQVSLSTFLSVLEKIKKNLLQTVIYSRLSLIRTPTGKIDCSNYREIRIIESLSKFKLAREFAEGEQKIVRIIERFEL